MTIDLDYVVSCLEFGEKKEFQVCSGVDDSVRGSRVSDRWREESLEKVAERIMYDAKERISDGFDHFEKANNPGREYKIRVYSLVLSGFDEDGYCGGTPSDVGFIKVKYAENDDTIELAWPKSSIVHRTLKHGEYAALFSEIEKRLIAQNVKHS